MGIERLAQHLLDAGTVTPEQVEEARRTQGFFGGELGSHLLKLGFVVEDKLGEALSVVTGVPYASREQLRTIPPEVAAVVSDEVVRRLKSCPFDREGRVLRVAMLNPRDAVAISEIQTASGCTVEPWVTCEYRLYQALERHWGVRASLPRAVSLAPPSRSGRQPPPTAEGPRDDGPGDVEIGLDGRPLDAEVTYEDHFYVTHGLGGDERSERVAETREEAAAPETVSDPMAQLERALASAEDRDRIARALLDYCEGRARRVALFAVSREGLRGIAGRGRAFDTERLRLLTVPVEPSTIFDTALRSRDFFFGVVPPLPANRDLYTALGGRLPSMAMVLPIPLKGRVAALLYLDDDDRPMTHPDIPLMRRVAAKAGLAFEILLLRGKLHKL